MHTIEWWLENGRRNPYNVKAKVLRLVRESNYDSLASYIVTVALRHTGLGQDLSTQNWERTIFLTRHSFMEEYGQDLEDNEVFENVNSQIANCRYLIDHSLYLD